MTLIKINFVDFANGLDPFNNWFTRFLSPFFDLEISDNPDFLFYSSFGHQHLNYSCTKIFFTGENDRPNFFLCDYGLGFDFNNSHKYLRLPLYVTWRDFNYKDLIFPEYQKIIDNNPKSKFCCFIVSNAKSPFRIEFFKKLNSIKRVDSGGKVLNNIDGPVLDKLEFMKPYKFMIAYENTSYPGYVTEKLYECYFANVIPIYWGSDIISKDFNPDRIICRKDFRSDEEMIDYILFLENDIIAYNEFIQKPVFTNNIPSEYFNEERIVKFFNRIFSGSNKTRSTGLRKQVGILIRKKRNLKKKLFKTDFR